MRRALAAAVLAAALLGALAVASATGRPAAPPLPDEALSFAKQAYDYGFPLLEFLRVRATETSVSCPDHAGHAPVNVFSNAKGFPGPRNRDVVAPNVDTLYSIAHLDLGKGPVVLTHPAMGKRYFVFELVDPYTNVIGYVGERTTGSRAGRFAITWTRHPGKKVKGARVIRSRYRRVWVIGRTLARGKADQAKAHALMRRYRLTPPGGTKKHRCTKRKPTVAHTPTGLAFLDRLGAAMAANPPPKRDRPLLAELRLIGVGPGRRPERAGLPADVLAAVRTGVREEAKALPDAARTKVLQQALAGHGWATLRTGIGRYGTHYAGRAEIAVVGLGANTADEAVYPTALADSDGQLLTGAHRYRLTFAPGKLPPARAFWSLTMYDLAGYLVPNRLHRYAVGSSHPPLVHGKDGSVVIALQRTRPTEKGVNWLPAPAGPFRLSLRLYWPRPSVLDGRWSPPPIRRVG